MDKDLGPIRQNFFVGQSFGSGGDSLRYGLIKEKNRNLTGRRIGKGIAFKNATHLRAIPDHDTNRLSHMLRQPPLKFGFYGSVRQIGIENDIPGLDIGPYIREAGLLTEDAQGGHRKLSGSADIYRAKQGDESFHELNLSQIIFGDYNIGFRFG